LKLRFRRRNTILSVSRPDGVHPIDVARAARVATIRVLDARLRPQNERGTRLAPASEGSQVKCALCVA